MCPSQPSYQSDSPVTELHTKKEQLHTSDIRWQSLTAMRIVLHDPACQGWAGGQVFSPLEEESCSHKMIGFCQQPMTETMTIRINHWLLSSPPNRTVIILEMDRGEWVGWGVRKERKRSSLSVTENYLNYGEFYLVSFPQKSLKNKGLLAVAIFALVQKFWKMKKSLHFHVWLIAYGITTSKCRLNAVRSHGFHNPIPNPGFRFIHFHWVYYHSTTTSRQGWPKSLC